MSEPSPRPWQVRYGDTVADATGARVCGCWRPENADLIVRAVNAFYTYAPLVKGLQLACDTLRVERDRAVFYADNAPHPGSAPWKEMREAWEERDRLRDLVRRLADFGEGVLKFAFSQVPESGLEPCEAAKMTEPWRKMLAEAREAIKEEAGHA